MPQGKSSGFRSDRILVPLVSAVLVFAGALGGAYFGARATVDTQEAQFREAQMTTARNQRAKVYTSFLAAANQYASDDATATTTIRADCRNSHALRPIYHVTCKHLPSNFLVPVSEARFAFQGALNEVYVYGSARGVLAARRVAGALPRSLIGLSATVPPLKTINEGALTDAYDAFLKVMCQEVSAEPRSKC